MTKKREELQPDEEAMQAWDKLPKNAPGKSALPPATGGVPRWLWALIVFMIAFGLLALILQIIGAL